MKRSSVVVMMMICIAFAIAVFLPAVKPVQAGGVETANSDGADLSKAAEYCVKKGGEVNDRAPYFNTNADQQDWLRLAGERQFCKFSTKKDGGSEIYVELSTLYTENPSLAALAYYAEVPPGNCNGNPASCYCSLLGGSDLFGGINASGGGWVKKSDPDVVVLEACIFPDMSTIDSWGLTYHSVGVIRGKDLSKVLRFPDPYAK